jgi:hypothetical protein
MVNANIDIFEMSYEESVSYLKSLENLENIRSTNDTLPTKSKNRVYITRSVDKASKNPSFPTFGVTIVIKSSTTLIIVE